MQQACFTMTGSIKSRVLISKCAKECWRLNPKYFCTKGTFSKDLAPPPQIVSQVTGGPGFNVAIKGLPRRDPGVLPAGTAYCNLPHARSSYRRWATVAADRSSSSTEVTRCLAFMSLMIGSGVATYYFYPRPKEAPIPETTEEVHSLSNWSNTHDVQTKVYMQPESLEELERVVQTAHEHKQKLRAVGSGLSPNGIGLCSEGMVNLGLMDSILHVDKKMGRVTVQAGARVEQVVEALKPYNLTLQNYASIKEQQIGGFIQVGAHGTGAKLPPVDEQVLALKLVTPAKGTLDLTPESDPELFYFARCGLGALGVVAEVTLQCVPRHRLLEYTFVTNLRGVQKNHEKWLSRNKHLRYMWIPDSNTVVVVQCNPLPSGKEVPKVKEIGADEKLKHVRALYKEIAAKYSLTKGPELAAEVEKPEPPSPRGKEGMWSSTAAAGDQEGDHSRFLSDLELSQLSFTELRDILIAFDPLNREHIIRVNQAEAEYWKHNEGYRTGWSDEILGFDCGGQQWVSEVSFPVGTLKNPNFKDVKYMEEVLKLIKEHSIPAPAPIEQRWTATSRSPLSPASSFVPETLFSWVGIIMYLPPTVEEQRVSITKSFFEYRRAAQRHLWDVYNAHEHWAKIEVPQDDDDSLCWVQERLRKRFPVETFNRLRLELDPNQILSNEHIDQLFPLSKSPGQ